MAELNASEKSGKRNSRRTQAPRIDLTAMVDLAFLLITFFMLTTVLNKPRSMPLNMPADGPPGPTPETRSMTICLGKDNQALWYLGIPDHPLTSPAKIDYGKDMDKAILQMEARIKKTSKDGLIVLVKPSDHSIYENLVQTLDELKITGVTTYAIARIIPQDIDMLKHQRIY